MFDGDTSTYTAANTGSTCSWTAPANTSYEIYFGKDFSAPPLRIPMVLIITVKVQQQVQILQVLRSTSLDDQWVKMSQVKINGKILVDTGISGDPGAGTLLTFTGTAAANNKDLKFFNPGDPLGAETGFKPVIYTGNGNTQSIDCGFSPDLVWMKVRTNIYNHYLYDTIRGSTKALYSNTTNDTRDEPIRNYLAFNSNGFTVGSDAGGNKSENYVAWCWDAGDTTVANTDGTIASQVRSNGNFSVVKYSGASITNATVGHGLSSAPKFLIQKCTSAADWPVFTTATGTYQFLYLNEPIGAGTPGQNPPDATTFSVWSDITSGQSGEDYIAYCWAETVVYLASVNTWATVVFILLKLV